MITVRERCAIAVMAKAPRPGNAKTRLVPPLSLAQAAELSACFIHDTSENIAAVTRQVPVDGYICFIPSDARFEIGRLVPAGTGLLPSRRSGLSASLYGAIEDLLSAGYASVCLVNADSPTLPTSVLVEAVQALLLPGDRVVLGPAEDGGYYLIGVKHAHARLFEDIAWSSSLVFAQTTERAREIGIETVPLRVWYDVDDVASLYRLEAELVGDGNQRDCASIYLARHTATLLRDLLRENAELGLALAAAAPQGSRAGP